LPKIRLNLTTAQAQVSTEPQPIKITEGWQYRWGDSPLNFITKKSRVGVGMGLSNAYNIIRKHNGEIKVESEVGKGTEVVITLPIEPNSMKPQ